MAEPISVMTPGDSKTARGGRFSIEFVASDPLWYGSVLEASVSRPAWTLDSGVLLDDGAHWLDQTSQAFAQILAGTTYVEACNAGTAAVRNAILSLAGRISFPLITNLRNGTSIYVARNFANNESMTIDCGARTIAINGVLTSPTGLVILGAGQTDWLRLEPGENSLWIQLGYAAGLTVAYSALYSPGYL